METGELYLYDPSKLLDGGDAQIFKNDQLHTGPVRGLDFNPIQKNLLLSGAINAEVRPQRCAETDASSSSPT